MDSYHVRERVAEIAAEAARGDNELAHELEDALWRDVLEAVANHHDDSAELAHLALRSTDVKFSRWRA